MKIDEITLIKVTLPTKKKMSGSSVSRFAKELDYWNLTRKSRNALRASIEKCLETGEEQTLHDDGVFIYVIKPRFPLIESAMKEPDNQNYLKVSISVFTQIRTLGVLSEDEDGPKWKGFLYDEVQLESHKGLSRVND